MGARLSDMIYLVSIIYAYEYHKIYLNFKYRLGVFWLDTARILNMSKVLGKHIIEYNGIYIIDNGNRQCTVLIPDDLRVFSRRPNDCPDVEYAVSLPNTIMINFDIVKVIGGASLKTIKMLFVWGTYERLDLSDFNVSNVEDMKQAFAFSNIKELIFGKFDTSNVKNMSQMFESAEIGKVDLSNFNTSNVKNMQSMFISAIIDTLDLKSFDTSAVTNMSLMFKQSRIHNLNISSFNTHNVTNMSGMFSKCESDVIDISTFDIENVRDMSVMFMKAVAKEINLSNLDFREVKNMRHFINNIKADVIHLPENFVKLNGLSIDKLIPKNTKIIRHGE